LAGAVTSILNIDDDGDDDDVDSCDDDDDDDDCKGGNKVILALRSYRLMVKMSRID